MIDAPPFHGWGAFLRYAAASDTARTSRLVTAVYRCVVATDA